MANGLVTPEPPRLATRIEAFPYERGHRPPNKPERAQVVLVEIHDGSHRGRGEAIPEADEVGEAAEDIMAIVEKFAGEVSAGSLGRRALLRVLPPGPARNALDCALWDLEAKRAESAVYQMAGLEVPMRKTTAYPLHLDTIEAMAKMAQEEGHRPILKLPLPQEHAQERLIAVHNAAPDSQLIVDGLGSWDLKAFNTILPLLGPANTILIERPLRRELEHHLATLPRDVPLCARGCRTARDLEAAAGLYDAVSFRLDETGGLTSALDLIDRAEEMGFRIAISSRDGTSLGAAPAVLLASRAQWIDLGQPLHLSRERQPGLRYDGSILYPPGVSLWG